MPLKKTLLKTNKAVKRITFAPTKPIGESFISTIQVGRVHFKDGTTKRVAIKTFEGGLDNETAKKYQKVINDLNKAGVPLPKMGMVLVPAGTIIQGQKSSKSEWVQVAQLFGSSKGSKFVQKSCLDLKLKEDKEEAAKIFANVVNTGHYPARDLIEPLKHKQGVVPIDIDYLVVQKNAPQNQKIDHLVTILKQISTTPEEFRRLSIITLRQLNLNNRKILREFLTRQK